MHIENRDAYQQNDRYQEKKKIFYEFLKASFYNVIEENLLLDIYMVNDENLTLFLNNAKFEELLLFIKYNVPIPITLQFINQTFEGEFKSKLVSKLYEIDHKPHICIKEEYVSANESSIYNKIFYRYLNIIDEHQHKNYNDKALKELNLIHKILKEGAFKNDPEAICYLGYFFQFEKGDLFQNVVAFKLIKLSYDMKFKDSIGYFAALHFDGIGVKKNVSKAIQLYEEAKSLGSINSTYMLGKIYLDGMDVKKDYKKAFHNLNIAYLSGNPSSSIDLGIMYKYGYGTKRNIDRARLLLSNAVIQTNDLRAYYELSLIHLFEEKYLNKGKGMNLLIYASEKFYPDAMCLLAEFCYYGRNIKVDVVKSISLLSKAKEMGHKKSEELYTKFKAELNNHAPNI